MSSIDQTGEFLTLVEEEEVDEVKQERLEVSRRREQKCARTDWTVGEIRGDCPAVTEREGALHSFMIKMPNSLKACILFTNHYVLHS